MTERDSKHADSDQKGGVLKSLATELGVAQPTHVEEVEKVRRGRPSASTGAQSTDSGASEP